MNASPLAVPKACVSKPCQDYCHTSKWKHTPRAHTMAKPPLMISSVWIWGLSRGYFNLTMVFHPQASS